MQGNKDTDSPADSDIDNLDFDNFKGIYFGDNEKKYTDPATGAHFEYHDFCKRLIVLKKFRKGLDKHLGVATSSMVLTPKSTRSPQDNTFDNRLKQTA